LKISWVIKKGCTRINMVISKVRFFHVRHTHTHTFNSPVCVPVILLSCGYISRLFIPFFFSFFLTWLRLFLFPFVKCLMNAFVTHQMFTCVIVKVMIFSLFLWLHFLLKY
jgi:hypothetical protein